MVSLKIAPLLLLFGAAFALPVEDSVAASDPYVAQINKYRAMMKPKARPALTYNAQLHVNSLRTVKDGNGAMHHEIFPPTHAQVLVPALPSECTLDTFIKGLVQGWICEKPSLLPAGTCRKDSGYDVSASTGHAEVLSSTEYTKVDCACYEGIWGCDFA